MEWIAHRGYADVNPENTVAAVRDAGARADAVAVDVRRCGSGDLFDPACLVEARDADPDVPRALLFADAEAALSAAVEADATVLHPAAEAASEAFVQRAHGAGFGVSAWTATDAATGRDLAIAGVDGLTDADPAAFTAFGYTIVGGRFARKVNTAPRLKP